MALEPGTGLSWGRGLELVIGAGAGVTSPAVSEQGWVAGPVEPVPVGAGSLSRLPGRGVVTASELGLGWDCI
jgi:hypothetical protein